MTRPRGVWRFRERRWHEGELYYKFSCATGDFDRYGYERFTNFAIPVMAFWGAGQVIQL